MQKVRCHEFPSSESVGCDNSVGLSHYRWTSDDCYLSECKIYLLFAAGGMVSHLKCFTNVEATEMKLCQEEDGFTSCFTKYNLG